MKSFDQYMAETGRQSELDTLRKNFGYDKAKAAYESSGSFGSSSGSVGNSAVNLGNILSQVQSTISGQIAPIVDTIKSQQPAITQAYGAAKSTLQGAQSSLKDKYTKLLADIKNVGTQQTQAAAKTTNAELARRGITADSTAASQEVQNVLNPIEQQTLAQENAATAAQGGEEQALANAIANLGISEQSAQGNILGQVANLLAGGVNSATSLGGNIYSQLVANEQQAKMAQPTATQQTTSDLQNKLLQQQLASAQSTAPLQLQKLQAEIKKLLSGGSENSGSDWS